jgi:hypothetical protein
MKKFNQFEAHLIKEGLEAVKQQFIKDIETAKSNGKHHLFSENYVDYIINETLTKLKTLTK